NFLGLSHMLMLAKKYAVKKFFLYSVGAVVDRSLTDAGESVAARPMTSQALQKSANEEFAKHWKSMYGTDITILRFSSVYGPGQLFGHGVIADLLHDILTGRTIEVAGSLQQTRDFIYVEDAAYAVYRAAERGYQGDVLNISSAEPVSYKQLLEICSGFATMPPVKVNKKKNGSFQQATLDNSRCCQELGWSIKRTLEDGLRSTYIWYKSRGKQLEIETQREKSAARRRQIIARIRPYFENSLLFLAMVFIMHRQEGSVVNATIGLDFNYVYIAAMGLLYGKRQSMPAALLSMGLLIYSFLLHGADIVGLLYLPQHMLHFASYLFVAVFTGYTTDSKNRTIANMEYRNQRAQERYEFLEDMYSENIKIKNKLYHQIVNSDDSIGRAYQIIKKLDSVELEDVYTQAAEVTAELLNAEQVAIYIVGKNAYYLRQKVRRGEKISELARSLKIEEFPYLQELMAKQSIFVNKKLEEGLPDLAAPVVFQNKVIAVIQIFDLDFEKWNLSQQNLLAVTARLIASALGKAYQYEEGIQSRKYIENTRIIRQEEFIKICREVRRRQQVLNNSAQAAYLRITAAQEPEALDRKLAGVVRTEDFIGEYEGDIYILLLDINQAIVEQVRQRLSGAGVETAVVAEVCHE
ncbi:MAG: NAD-dependent epimerase/dehydratase family protein, partial [Selenomonadaceae bacterium]